MENNELKKQVMLNGYFMYCRKSSESEDQQMESIPAQVEALTQLAEEKELIVNMLLKESMSAKDPGRPEFNKMVSLIEEHGVKGILCWKLNRLFRNPKDEGMVRWLLSCGKIKEIITPTKTYRETDSDFTMAVEGAQGQRFIRDLREDTARGINNKLKKGLAPILAPPGYKNDIHMRQGEKTISPHPVYFEMVRVVFNLALTGNWSVQKLYEKAGDMGIRNSRNQEISRSQMYRILTNPFYKGNFIYAGRLYPGVHKAMISSEEFDLIQDNLRQRSRPRGQGHIWSLSGLIKCEFCGHLITFEKHVKKSGLVFCHAKCTGKYRYNCPQVYVPLKDLEKQAHDFLGRIKVSSRFVEWAIKVLKRATDEEKEVYQAKYKALRHEQDEIKEKLYNLQMKWATTSLIEEEVFNRGTEELKARRKKIHQILESEDKDFDQITDLTLETFKFARDAQAKWEEGDPVYRKGIMRVIGSSLVLTRKGKLEIRPRGPFLIIKNAVKKEPAVQSPLRMLYARLNSEFEANPGVKQFSNPILGD